jgi:hypothetical protein
MTSFVGAAGLKPTALPPAGGMRYNHSLFISSTKDIKKAILQNTFLCQIRRTQAYGPPASRRDALQSFPFYIPHQKT